MRAYDLAVPLLTWEERQQARGGRAGRMQHLGDPPPMLQRPQTTCTPFTGQDSGWCVCVSGVAQERWCMETDAKFFRGHRRCVKSCKILKWYHSGQAIAHAC